MTMARKKRVATHLISIREAAQMFHLTRRQIEYLCWKHHLQPQPNPSQTDRRYTWYPREVLAAYVAIEHPLPLAS